MSQQPKKEKKLPVRRCVGCGEHKEKPALLRIVRTPDGEIRFDTTGRAAGRGAYLCKSKKCLARARKTRRLEQNLGVEIPDAVYAALESELADD